MKTASPGVQHLLESGLIVTFLCMTTLKSSLMMLVVVAMLMIAVLFSMAFTGLEGADSATNGLMWAIVTQCLCHPPNRCHLH